MKAARLHGFGIARDVLRVEAYDPGPPGPGQLALEMLAAAVNPADLNVIEGTYGELPDLPGVIGNEGVGRVAEVGPGVEGFAVGDWVLPLSPGSWTERRLIDARNAFRLPEGLDPHQAALLAVNPPTAWALLEDFVDLQPGDWVVQNAANSAVGRCVIQIARARELRTINVVRRPDLESELRELGADVVVEESCSLREEIESLCGGSRPKLALNAVGGASALNLANGLAERGTLVTYGAMGRQPLKIPNGLLIFRGLSFQGFWLRRWKENLTPAKRVEVFASLACACRDGVLRQAVQSVYPLERVHEALEEAATEGRRGKVLLSLNG